MEFRAIAGVLALATAACAQAAAPGGDVLRG